VTQSDDERRKLAIQRLKVRAEMRSAHELEDSVVIQQRAEERQKAASLAPPSGNGTAHGPFAWLVQPVIAVLKLVPPPHRVFIAGLLVLTVFAGIGKARGWW
jgi:hypothetical protein